LKNFSTTQYANPKMGLRLGSGRGKIRSNKKVFYRRLNPRSLRTTFSGKLIVEGSFMEDWVSH